jgi:hypothetical protein
MSDSYHRPTLTFPDGAYSATQVRLYGIEAASFGPQAGPIGIAETGIMIHAFRRHDEQASVPLYLLRIETKGPGLVIIAAISANVPTEALSAGIIVGYAFEGHCYDLPKPKIMLLRTPPRTIPVDDCGYDEKAAEGYKVWIVDKLDECVELEVNQGFVEQLILEANLPGKRSPTMYAGRMMLAHRSGRLQE